MVSYVRNSLFFWKRGRWLRNRMPLRSRILLFWGHDCKTFFHGYTFESDRSEIVSSNEACQNLCTRHSTCIAWTTDSSLRNDEREGYRNITCWMAETSVVWKLNPNRTSGIHCRSRAFGNKVIFKIENLHNIQYFCKQVGFALAPLLTLLLYFISYGISLFMFASKGNAFSDQKTWS